MPKVSLLPGTKLANGRTIVTISWAKGGKEGVVLAVSEHGPDHYAVWNIDRDGSTFTGTYCEHFDMACFDFNRRVAKG